MCGVLRVFAWSDTGTPQCVGMWLWVISDFVMVASSVTIQGAIVGGQEGTRRTPCCSTAEQDGHWCRVIVTTGTVCRNREERTSTTTTCGSQDNVDSVVTGMERHHTVPVVKGGPDHYRHVEPAGGTMPSANMKLSQMQTPPVEARLEEVSAMCRDRAASSADEDSRHARRRKKRARKDGVQTGLIEAGGQRDEHGCNEPSWVQAAAFGSESLDSCGTLGRATQEIPSSASLWIWMTGEIGMAGFEGSRCGHVWRRLRRRLRRKPPQSSWRVCHTRVKWKSEKLDRRDRRAAGCDGFSRRDAMRLTAWMRLKDPEMSRRWIRQRKSLGSKDFNWLYGESNTEDEFEKRVNAESTQADGWIGADWIDFPDNPEREARAEAIALCAEVTTEVSDTAETRALVRIVNEEDANEALAGITLSEMIRLVDADQTVTEYDDETLELDANNETGYKDVEHDPLRAPMAYGATVFRGWKARACRQGRDSRVGGQHAAREVPAGAHDAGTRNGLAVAARSYHRW